MDQNNDQDLDHKVRAILAEFLGIETEDIDDDDSLTIDLQMKPSDLTDFVEILEGKGLDTSKLDFSEIETVSELIESLGDENI